MQAKRRRISMANISTQPRPEERSLRRSVSKDASVSANGDATGSFPSTSSGLAFETPRFCATPQNEVGGRATRALGRGKWRALLLTGLSAVAMVCSASVALADPQSPASSSRADLGADMRILAPLAPT